MSNKAEYFMESLYFTTGCGETAVVDAVDETVFTGTIEQPLSDVVGYLVYNTPLAEYDDKFHQRLIESCNQFFILRLAEYARRFPQPEYDSAEFEVFHNFCRLCDRYKPNLPKIPASSPVEVYQYFNDMLGIAAKYEVIDALYELHETPEPRVRVDSRMVRNDEGWHLNITIDCDTEHLDSLDFVLPEHELSADDAALRFNRLLLGTPYRTLAIHWGEWGEHDGI